MVVIVLPPKPIRIKFLQEEFKRFKEGRKSSEAIHNVSADYIKTIIYIRPQNDVSKYLTHVRGKSSDRRLTGIDHRPFGANRLKM